MTLPLLLLLAAAGQAPAGPTVAQLRSTVREAFRAVESDSVPLVLRRFQARAAADPAARLGAATVARLVYDYPTADRLYRELLAAHPSPSPLHLYARIGLGTSQAWRWQFAAAGQALSDAALEARRLADPSGEVESMLLLAIMVGRQGRVDSARALVLRSDSLAVQAEPELRARARCSLSGMLRGAASRRGDSVATEGLALAVAAGDRRVLAGCLMAKAMVMEALGMQNTATDFLDSATSVSRAARDRHALAATFQIHTYFTVQYSATFWEGPRQARAAIVGGKATGNILAAAWARLNLAQLASRLGDFPSATAQADSARQEMLTLGDKFGEAASLYVLAESALLGGDYARAERAFQSCDSLYTLFNATGSRMAVVFRRAALFRLTGKLDSSRAMLGRVQEYLKTARLPGLANDALYEEGMQAMAERRWADAATQFTAFSQRVGGADKEFEHGWHYRLDADARTAESLAQLGKFDEAQRVLDSTLIRVYKRRLYYQYRNREGQLALLQARRFDFDPDLGVATTINLFARGGRVEEALLIAEAWRGQYLNAGESRRLALLPDTAQSRKAADTLARRLLPTEARQTALLRALPDSTAFLMYTTGRGGEPTTLFVGLRDTLAAFTLAPADSLVRPIARFGAALEGGGQSGLGEQLGADLLQPALAMLPARISRLVIVPDGPLHRVPFDALGVGGKKVLERYGVSLAPSLRLAAQWWTAPAPTPRRALVLADPVFGRETGLTRLAGSAMEGREVARRVSGATLYTGRDATAARLTRSAADDLGLLHLATHAEVQDRGILSSALFLSPDGDSDGRLDVAKITALRLADALVVLSSCRTLGGAVVNGEGLQGLTTPFMEAGARTIVATHWAVGDHAIRLLMADFYRLLAGGADVVQAARGAKLAALRRGEPASAWASLAVVGDGGMRPRVF